MIGVFFWARSSKKMGFDTLLTSIMAGQPTPQPTYFPKKEPLISPKASS